MNNIHHIVFSYLIYRKDGEVDSGSVPYRGTDIDKDTLIQFIADYFTGFDDSYRVIAVSEPEHFADELAWMQYVHKMDSFLHLQKINNYAGDVVARYNIAR